MTDQIFEETVYVFCPEEPEQIVLLGQSSFKFGHGRIDSKRYPAMTRSELEWFASNKHFIVATDLDDAALHLMLSDRVVTLVGRGIGASDIGVVMQKARLQLAFMLTPAGADSVRDVEIESSSVLSMAKVQQPSLANTLEQMTEMSQAHAKRQAEELSQIQAEAPADLDEIKSEEDQIKEDRRPLDVPATFNPPSEEEQEAAAASAEPVKTSTFG